MKTPVKAHVRSGRPVRRHLRWVIPKQEEYTPSWMSIKKAVRMVDQLGFHSTEEDERRIAAVERNLREGIPLDPIAIDDYDPDRAYIVDGLHRVLAAKQSGVTRVPYLRVDPDEPI